MNSYRNTDPRPPIMRGAPPPPDQRVTLDNWDRPPFNRWSFQNVRQVLPTATVHRGNGPVCALPRAAIDLSQLTFDNDAGVEITVDAFLEESYTDGFIVLHQGHVVFERYYNAMTERTLHLSQSVGKSICGTVAGILMGRGILDPDAPLKHYVPEFAGCGYGTATVQQAMDMRSGVGFSEVYTDPNSDIAKFDLASGWKPRPQGYTPACTFDLLLGLDRERDHGGDFSYRSVEIDAVAFCMERATGMTLPELVSAELWAHLGMEEDADFTVDSAGYALASGGFNATLRDYARFALMHLNMGLFNGRQIVPAEWVAQCQHGDHAIFGAPYTEALPDGAYRNQFWIERPTTRAYMARGVFGQLIYIDPDNDITAVKLSTWPDFQNVQYSKDTLHALHAIAAALNG
jgi:hypothetical protein